MKSQNLDTGNQGNEAIEFQVQFIFMFAVLFDDKVFEESDRYGNGDDGLRKGS